MNPLLFLPRSPAACALATAWVLTSAFCLYAADDASAPAAALAPPAPPVAQWHFDGKDALGVWQGSGHREAVGPQAPTYPEFAIGNRAAELAGKDAALFIKDTGADGPNLRFGKDDAITIEAWVKTRSLRDGQQVYLVGKGRHRTKEFGEMNQNYALRLKGAEGAAEIGFLFSSQAEAGKPAAWHRWWSSETFASESGWHHVAVSYVFGKKESLHGYIDGNEVKGAWDMGGATDRPPVNDGDALMIGTGFTHGTTETLDGWLDEVAIYRQALSPDILKARFAYLPPPPVIGREKLTPGRVLVQICEKGIPEKSLWPAEPPAATESYFEDVFGFSELPQKYISTGVRDDRPSSFLVRAAALVTLPKGTHRLLLRGRGATRLYIDGKEVLKTPFPKGDTGGHGLVSEQNAYLNLGPDFRFAPPGNRESSVEFKSAGASHLVVLETILGGGTGKNRMRPELGETVVACSLEGQKSWSLLSPGTRQVAYTDAGWAAYEKERGEHYSELNAQARLAKRKEHAGYWAGRRVAAQEWLASTPEVRVPELPPGFPAQNEIDRFLGDRIARLKVANAAAPKDGIDFFREVQPILESKCYSCHHGGKAKGNLHLDSRVAALKGGKNDGPALVAGKPEESPMFQRVGSDNADEVMPPKGKGDPLTKGEVAILERWIKEGGYWPEFHVTSLNFTPLTDDLTFLRRASLDTIGVVPSEADIQAFLADAPSERRSKVIDRLLEDPRWADHNMGYWQDVLAENPNILNPTLNNTGPFRWWIYESLVDDKPMDLFVTELIRMEGSERFGGPAGFGVASQNDVPMAAKAIVVSAAFQGVEMKCARCHDAPSNVSKQEDLFQLAAMLEKKAIKLPASSSVPPGRITQGGRKPLIEVTLLPGSTVEPKWPLGRFSPEPAARILAEHPDDPRDRLAALLTGPQNTRFAQVMVNRFWQRLMGRGIVESVADWEKAEPSHPELLQWLGREFVRSGYRAKAIYRLILNSHAYQRATDPSLRAQEPLFVAPAPRKLTSEQIVDSLFAATGKPFNLEEVSLDIDGSRGANNSISLGKPRRAWMLTSTSNERDRPSLSLPRIQAVADVMEIFGWRGARVEPTSVRETSPNVLQPAILSNGTVGGWLTQLSDDHGVTQLALENQPVEKLVERLFLRLLTRLPSPQEREVYTSLLANGYETRVVGSVPPPPSSSQPRVRTPYVSWSNHLDGEATILRQEQGAKARRGDPPTARLEANWRARLEDVLWALLNAPSWITIP